MKKRADRFVVGFKDGQLMSTVPVIMQTAKKQYFLLEKYHDFVIYELVPVKEKKKK